MAYLDTIMGDQEQVLFTTRRHWLVIARSIITSVILALVIIAVTLVAASVLTSQTSVSIPEGLPFLLLLLLIVPLGSLVTTYLTWHNEQYIVTNRRIIQMEGVFNKHVIDSSLEKVNDIVMSQTFMGRLLSYGDIEILTASEIGVNKLVQISDPIRFKTTLLNAKEGITDSDTPLRRADAGTSADKSEPELIAELAELRARGILTEEEFQAKKTDLMSRM
jgi:uncharacterized membrane protein YdbT with pleckstrin-like domain